MADSVEAGLAGTAPRVDFRGALLNSSERHEAPSFDQARVSTVRVAFKEHQLVRTKRALREDGVAIPAGAVGVVVDVHGAGDAYEAELDGAGVGRRIARPSSR